MDIKALSADELLERRTAIGTAVEDPEADLDALEAEVRAINEELETRKNNEAKKAEVRQAIAQGEQPAEKIKDFKEVTKMDERIFTPDTAEYRDAYMKQLMGKPMSMEERTALTTAANVIPTETLDKIYGKLQENGLIAEIDALRIPGYVSVPVATTVNDASWISMSSASTDSADVVGSVSLTAKKLIKTIEITADIKAMSIPAFQSWLVNKLAQKMEAAIEAAVVNGAGSTAPTGVGQCGITASTAIAGATVAKLAAFMAGVKSAYHKNAVWIMSAENFFTHIVPLATDSNGAVVMNGIDYRLLGHKVVFSDACDSCKFKSGSTAEGSNADHIIFGNLKEGYVFNYGEGIAIEADQSVAFRSGSTVYRAMALCDGAVVDKEAFAWCTIAAS